MSLAGGVFTNLPSWAAHFVSFIFSITERSKLKILYYYHVPKCGGTTISRLLREMARASGGEYYNFNFPMEKFGAVSKIKNDLRLSRRIRRLTRPTSHLKFVHHHHGYYGLSEVAESLKKAKESANSMGYEFQVFTCVREPISFQLSRINYLRNRGHIPNITFEDVCINPIHQNVMYKYILYNHTTRWRDRPANDNLFHAANSVLDKTFILERYEDLVSWLGDASGVSVPNAEERENVGNYKLMPTDEQLEQLKCVNHLDQALYDMALAQSDSERRGAACVQNI